VALVLRVEQRQDRGGVHEDDAQSNGMSQLERRVELAVLMDVVAWPVSEDDFSRALATT
jgi:hypothetical protein